VIALRGLYRNKLRTTLTIGAVTAGVATLVTALSVSAGVKRQVADTMRRARVDVTVQSRGAIDAWSSRLAVADYERLRGLDGVRGASAVVLERLRTPWNSYFLITGISAVEPLSSRIGLVEGRFFEPGKRELILGDLAARRLGYGVGNKILLAADEVFSITGIYSLGVGLLDSAAVLDLGDAQRLTNRRGFVNLAFLQVAADRDAADLIAAINRSFPGLIASPSGRLLDQTRVAEVIDFFVRVLVGASVVTCGLIVANSLLMAISERTREIGLLLAVGWTRPMVVRLVLGEAVVMCAVAGIAGSLLAWLLLLIFARSRAGGVGWIPGFVPVDIAVEGMGLALGLGVLSGLYPAILASRVLPADALRFE